MKKKIVIFDFDGVIVNTFDMAVGILNLAGADVERFRSLFEGNLYDVTSSKTLTTKLKNLDSYFLQYKKQITDQKLIDHMDDIIKYFSKKYILYIISSTSGNCIWHKLKQHKLNNFFKDVLGPEVHKDKVIKINKILSEHNCRNVDALLITDTLGDIREAHEAGVESIAVTWGFHDRETLAQGKPYAIVEEPQDIVHCVELYFKET